jgi:hypothetical protein
VGGDRDHPLLAHSHVNPREVDDPGERVPGVGIGDGHDPRAMAQVFARDIRLRQKSIPSMSAMGRTITTISGICVR